MFSLKNFIKDLEINKLRKFEGLIFPISKMSKHHLRTAKRMGCFFRTHSGLSNILAQLDEKRTSQMSSLLFAKSLGKKAILFSVVFFVFQICLFGQLQLDVAGDTKIQGRLEIIQSAGDPSIFIGANAGLNDDGTNNNNVFIGNQAGQSNVSGALNVFTGSQAGQSNSSGGFNVFTGSQAGRSNVSGSQNVFTGFRAGHRNTTGFANVFTGSTAGQSNTTGRNNTFIGQNSGSSITTGTDNTFIGVDSGDRLTKGNRNVFIGNDADAISHDSLDKSIAIGYNAKVACHSCAVIGGSNADAVKVGIDMTTPLWPLHINNPKNALNGIVIDASELSLVLEKPTSLNNQGVGIGFQSGNQRESVGAAIIHEKTGNESIGKLHFATKSDDVIAGDIPIRMTLDETGNLGIGDLTPNCKLDVSGTICSNDVVLTSDRRFKKQIKIIEKPLAKIKRLEGVTYQMRSSEFHSRNFSTGKKIGLIAQNVEKVFPELVKTFEDGYKAVNYDGLIPVLLEGMKTQQQTIDNQEIRINQQQEQIEKLTVLVKKLITEKPRENKIPIYKLPLEQKARLLQNHPNPFSLNTRVDYFLPANVLSAFLQITSVDGKILGKVKIDQIGKGQVQIKAHTYPTGTYFYSLIADGQVVETKRMVLTR